MTGPNPWPQVLARQGKESKLRHGAPGVDQSLAAVLCANTSYHRHAAVGDVIGPANWRRPKGHQPHIFCNLFPRQPGELASKIAGAAQTDKLSLTLRSAFNCDGAWSMSTTSLRHRVASFQRNIRGSD